MRAAYLGGLLVITATLVNGLWFHIDYRLAANVALLCIAALVTVFTALYGLRSRWKSNRIGKVFLVKGVTLSLVLWQSVATVWIGGDYPYRDQIRFVIYAMGAVAYAAMVAMLWREQQNDRHSSAR